MIFKYIIIAYDCYFESGFKFFFEVTAKEPKIWAQGIGKNREK